MVVLASKSPRRRELLKQIVDDFISTSSDIDESLSNKDTPLETCLDISKRKAYAVKDNYPHDLIITADTIVVIDNTIIGKPKDENDAKRILNLLSGKTHEVITCYTLLKEDKMINHYVKSYVTFNELSPSLIDEYVASKSPLDKAGAYGVQDNEKYHIIKDFIGSMTNIMGLPVDELRKDFELINK